MTLRPLTHTDETLLWPFLALAAHETDLAIVQANPQLARYVVDWGRIGDSGFVALRESTLIGAVWLRLWPNDDKGFGWVADDIPELAMAVAPEWRGQGIGEQLLRAVLRVAQGEFRAVSLSVRDDNPAVRLYERCGFRPVEGSATTNRVGGVSFNMLAQW